MTAAGNVSFGKYIENRFGAEAFQMHAIAFQAVSSFLAEAEIPIEQDKYKKALKKISKASSWKKSK